MLIREDDFRGAEIATLLEVHPSFAATHSPPGHDHAFDLDGLRAPDVTFWTAWEASDLLGCGALKELDPQHGEIKSMHTAAAHRGKGVGGFILKHIMDAARQRSYRRLSLETGAQDAFAPARALYARFGFEICGYFSGYTDNPHSVYMKLEI